MDTRKDIYKIETENWKSIFRNKVIIQIIYLIKHIIYLFDWRWKIFYKML